MELNQSVVADDEARSAVPGKSTHRHGYLTVLMTDNSRRIDLTSFSFEG